MKVVLICGALGTRREHSVTIRKALARKRGDASVHLALDEVLHSLRAQDEYDSLTGGHRGDWILEYFRKHKNCKTE